MLYFSLARRVMREKEMLTDKKRKTIIFLIAVMQNLVFFVVSYFTKLPLWLDTTGTIYISILLGYQFGFCVGLINSLFSALFFYGYHSIIFYLVSFSVAILSDVIYHRINKRKKWIQVMWKDDKGMLKSGWIQNYKTEELSSKKR